MPKKLFVGGLSWDTTDHSLADAFAQFGEVREAKVITDRETGRSRGFGFVTFTDGESGSAAMKEMDGQPIDGRSVRVNEAEERRPRSSSGGGYGGRSNHSYGGGGYGGGGGW